MTDRPTSEEQAHQVVADLLTADTNDDQATERLVELGDAALPALSTAIGSKNAPAQQAAAIALSRLTTRRALAPILNGVLRLTDSPELMATLLHTAAGLLTPQDKDRVRPLLLRCLQHQAPTVRLATIECARATNDQRTLDAIAQSRVTRQDADTSEQTQNTVPRAASMDLIKELASTTESVRKQACTTLLNHPDRNQIVVEHLHHADANIRRSVLEVAAVVGKPAWNQALIDITADKERDLQERVLALRGVQNLGVNPSDVHLAATLLHHRDESLRAEAGRLSATSNDVTLRRGALNLLSSDVPWVRKRVAEGWATFADTNRQGDLPHLIEILRSAPWLPAPAPMDIETFQSLCGGIIRMIELGCFLDGTLLDEFASIQRRSDQEIADVVKRTTDTLSQSTGIIASIDNSTFDIRILYHDDLGKRLQLLEGLRAEPVATLHAMLPELIRFIYIATPAELVLMTQLLCKLTDRRAVEALTRMTRHPSDTAREAAQQALSAQQSA